MECFVCFTYNVPSSSGILVHRLVTSIDTSNMPFATFVFSIKFRKSVVSLRYDS